MRLKKIDKNSGKPTILVVPLDWGLGHATRCIPLIQELLHNGCEVIVGADSALKSLLHSEFQHLIYIPLRGYSIRYSRKGKGFPLKILMQVPRILYTIVREHLWLKKMVKKYSIDAVITDNRFGLYHRSIPSVYITHQLVIKTGNHYTEKLAGYIHNWFIKKFTSCWVPDFEGKENIAGELSHPAKSNRNISYIGGLSRFEKKANLGKVYDLLVVISGPEPQRSIFEELMLSQLRHFEGRVLLVRGLPGRIEGEGNNSLLSKDSHISIKNHLPATELNEVIQQSTFIISRSGYTTVMDLLKLGQKAIFVPTPGQTEQQYLADHLMKQQFFYSTGQDNFNLINILQEASKFPFVKPSFNMELYKEAVYKFVQSI